jgi:glycosyltransferase involved in cell wall biosynthesis
VRATLRSELGIAPGAHMVLGYDAARTRSEGTGWYRHLQAADRRDIALVRIHAPSGPGWAQPTVRVVGPRGHSALPQAALLAASDVFVTTDRNLHAFSFAVAAVEQGLPVVTTTIDTAADLVLALGCGAVVPPMAHAVAGATLSLLNDGRRRPAHVPAPESPHRQIADLGRALLTAYRRVLRAELVGGAA